MKKYFLKVITIILSVLFVAQTANVSTFGNSYPTTEEFYSQETSGSSQNNIATSVQPITDIQGNSNEI